MSLIDIIDKAIGHFDVSCVVYEMYKEKYRFTSTNKWYTYDADTQNWTVLKDSFELSKKLSIEVSRKFLERAVYWTHQACDSIEEDDIKKCQHRAKLLNEIGLKLRSHGYKNIIIKECKVLFYDKDFPQ